VSAPTTPSPLTTEVGGGLLGCSSYTSPKSSMGEEPPEFNSEDELLDEEEKANLNEERRQHHAHFLHPHEEDDEDDEVHIYIVATADWTVGAQMTLRK
jgi:hypothetical protein